MYKLTLIKCKQDQQLIRKASGYTIHCINNQKKYLTVFYLILYVNNNYSFKKL